MAEKQPLMLHTELQLGFLDKLHSLGWTDALILWTGPHEVLRARMIVPIRLGQKVLGGDDAKNVLSKLEMVRITKKMRNFTRSLR